MISPAHNLYLTAVRRADAGDVNGAISLLDEVLITDRRHAAAAHKLAELLIERDPVRSVTLARAVLNDYPNNTDLMFVLAQALDKLGEPGEVANTFLRAVELRPNDAVMHANAALSLARIQKLDKALEHIQIAIKLNPKYPLAHSNHGHILNSMRRFREAIDAFVVAVELMPQNDDLYSGIATAHSSIGLPSVALLALQRAVELKPTKAGLHISIAGALAELGAQDDAVAAHRYALTLLGPEAKMTSNHLMALQYVPGITEAELLEEAVAWGLRESMVAMQPRLPADLNPERKLRIGYVSADLHAHPVGWLGAAAIAKHDRKNFEIYIYANQTQWHPITGMVQENADVWRSVFGVSDVTTAHVIAQDKIDILIDLSGHTGGHRMSAFARRPAPVQIHWLGYFATTGLPSIRYILLDDEHIAPGGEAQFSEEVIRLPNGRFCYYPPDHAEEPKPPPSDSTGFVMFGCFNNAVKLNAHTIGLWARILQQVPGSKIMLKWRSMTDPVLSRYIRELFAEGGISEDRVIMESDQPHPEFLKRYHEIDIALDPMPFSGAQTTVEALWMGVPVVTLPGQRAVSRQTYAIVSRINGPNFSGNSLVAKDDDDYVRIAVELALDAERRREMRREMRPMFEASPLRNPRILAQDLENVYRDVWRRHCAEETARLARLPSVASAPIKQASKPKSEVKRTTAKAGRKPASKKR